MSALAVIGAGAAGLIATRELLNEGHKVTIFEKSNRIGGLWVYNPQVESFELGQNNTSHGTVHSSVYKSLRTNLPRVLMQFTGFAFSERKYGDPRKFPGHEEVLGYLSDFAGRCGVSELVKFESEVVRVERVTGRVDKWVVEWKVNEGNEKVIFQEEVFDAVVVCSGHCTVPRLADVPGIWKWPGKQTHSHNYRVPEPFANQVVVVIGNGPSACDISRDISKAAKEVHISSRSPDAKFEKLDHYDNLWQHSAIHDTKEDGTVEFEDGSSVQASIIMHCTGQVSFGHSGNVVAVATLTSTFFAELFRSYKYEFPFLNTNGLVTIDDNCVGPLYKHVFPPELAPWLSFVGLPQKIIIFDMLQMQSKWVARVLSGRARLPATQKMMAEVQEYYQQMTLLQRPKHLTHFLLNSEEYLNCLAAEAGISEIEEWRKEIYRETVKCIQNNHDGFRDE